MTATKDIQNRPSNPHRLSFGGLGSSLPSRASVPRIHSQSISNAALNASHRVSRRKSTASVAGVNVAAVAAVAAAATRDTSDTASPLMRAKMEGLGISAPMASSLPAPALPLPSVVVSMRQASGSAASNSNSPLLDGPPLSPMPRGVNKARARRASEGQRSAKERSKSAAGELRCDTCGKGYKHGSCLTKHLWEHTPEWALTSKLLISKHQQVQLLEAASVLVAMNQDGTTPSNPAVQSESDNSSASPAGSGSSDPIEEDDMSSRTSTPSQDESAAAPKYPQYTRTRRQDSYSSAFSHSYQSTAGTSMPAGSMPMYRQWSNISHAQSDDDHESLASAAEGLLTCSLGTPQVGPTHVTNDVPPVSALPLQLSKYNGSPDVDMDDDQDGVFGEMEQ